MDKFKSYFMCPKVNYQSTKGIYLNLALEGGGTPSKVGDMQASRLKKSGRFNISQPHKPKVCLLSEWSPIFTTTRPKKVENLIKWAYLT